MSAADDPHLVVHRPARVFPPAPPTEPIVIAAPPQLPGGGGLGAVLSLLLPLAGGAGMLAFALVGGARRMLLVAGLVGGLSVGASVAMWLLQVAGRRRRTADLTRRYHAHLDQRRAALRAAAATQRAAAGRLHPDAGRLPALVADRRRVWERRPEDDDFLSVRLGLGALPLAAPVSLDLGTDPMAEHHPGLLAAANELVGAYRSLPDVPVTVSLDKLGWVAISGQRPAARALVRSMLCELAAFHAPGDLRLLAWSGPAEAGAWAWLARLPHANPGPGPGAGGAGLATTMADLEVLLDQVVRPRLDLAARAPGPAAGHPDWALARPQVVVVLDGYQPGGEHARLGILDELTERAAAAGVLVLAIVDGPDQVPARVGARARVGPAGQAGVDGVTWSAAGPGGREERATLADAAPLELCHELAAAMTGLHERRRRDAAATVDSPGLLDLLGLPATGRWPAGPGVDGWPARPSLLATPVGLSDEGVPAVLDLTEPAEGGMGPHGLVVGATGSGKSELLRTLVAGLAAGHTTDELAFVLADYKGGATFGDLAGLPHVAGVITNLERDPALVDRMQQALFGELERRQRLLAGAGLDRVRDWQARRAGGDDLEPLPSLLVVVDEFGELLTARPDFLDLFVSIGRTGRSLGVHLLLASQRLEAGRLRGLEGHLRYRVCLRTFSPEESMAALGTRAAAELPPVPGLAFLAVDGVARRFKVALATRPARPGHGPEPARPSGRPPTELQVLVHHLRTTGAAARAPLGADAGGPVPAGARRPGPVGATGTRPVWLPPLPGAVPLGTLLPAPGGPGGPAAAPAAPGGPGWLQVPLGLLDRPRAQAQVPLVLDLAGAGGHLVVVGAPRSGKSTLLQAFVAGLAAGHDPAAVQVYAVDLGGGGLHALAGLPHVGAVAGRGDREQVHRLVRELRRLVEQRAASARPPAGDGGRERDPYGEVFLVIDNWAGFSTEFGDLAEQLTELSSTGLHHGVHLVLSANRWNDLRLALRDNLGGRLELRLNDPVESELDRHAARGLPAGVPGRGITRDAEQFQAALPGLGDAPGAGPGALVAAIAGRWAGHRQAPPIRTLPAEVRPADLPPPGTDAEQGAAIGVEEFGLAPLRLDLFGADGHLLVLGDDGCGKTGLLRGLLSRLAAANGPGQVRFALVDPRRQLTSLLPADRLVGHAVTPGGIAELAERVADELLERLPASELDGAAGHHWSGPELVLVVDDYDLVAGPASSPLAGLADLLGQGRDIGFHAVVARRVGGLARSTFEPFLARLRELSPPVLLLSGDPDEGPVVGRRAATRLPPGRGELLRRGAGPVLVQALNHPPAPAPVASRPAPRPPRAVADHGASSGAAAARAPAHPGAEGRPPSQPPLLVVVDEPLATGGAA